MKIIMTNSIAGPKQHIRESNFELLRIIAMFMVLVLHADYQALGAPTRADIISYPIASALKVFFEMASIVAVNIFVLISGWFGIKPSIKGFSKFVFQCLFFSIGIYLVMILLGYSELSIRGLAGCFALFGGSYWFILSYIGLYLFSPVLNSFIKSADKKTFLYVLVGFYIFQTGYAFLGGGANFLMKGYSALSFMGLYLLINYVKRHVNYLNYSKIQYLIGYIIASLVLTIIYIGAGGMGYSFISSRMCCYSNPLVIISALLLFLYFAQLKLNNRFINWLGASSFAVYLFHCNPNMYELYLNSIKTVVVSHNNRGYIIVLGVIVGWFLVAVLVDKLRVCIWNRVAKEFERD